MELTIEAKGPSASGKSFILERVAKLLELYGFTKSQEVFMTDVVTGIPTEQLVMTRADDEAHFIMGEKMIPLGDWIIELDEKNSFVAAYHKGVDVNAREVDVSFAYRQLTTISTRNVAGRDVRIDREDGQDGDVEEFEV